MSRQLQLFDSGPPDAPRGGPVQPAAASADLCELAAALPAGLRLGTSSWSFPGWAGLVYRRAETKSRLARAGLAAYARHPLLRAVGIDRTFYAPIAAADFAAYATEVPDDFRFLVKAPALCTMPRLRLGRETAGEPNDLFLQGRFATDEVVGPFVEGLGAKAGPLVFQFSPLGPEICAEPERFAARLGEFLAGLPRGPLYAIELRDAALLGEPYVEALAAAGACHCYSVHPRMPPLEEQRRLAGERAAGPLVVRWMLGQGLGYEEAVSRYEPFSRLVDEAPAVREQLAEMCVEHVTRARPVVVVANNKAEGSAPLSVFRLAAAVAGRLAGRQPPG